MAIFGELANRSIRTGWYILHVLDLDLQLVRRLKERVCIVLFAIRVQLGAADGLQILFLLAAGSQQPFTARPGPKIRLGADRMKFGSFLQGA